MDFELKRTLRMVVQQLSVFLKNQPGVLAELLEGLAGQNVNVRAMSVSDTIDHAVVRLVVDDPHKALHLLGDRGVLVVETEVLAVELPNEPGALAKLARKLAAHDVNIEYAYGSADAKNAIVVLRTSDIVRAQQVLR